MNKDTYCIMTSGRLFDSPYGEEKFTFLLGRWLAKQNLNVVLMGSTFAGVKIMHLSKDEIETCENVPEKKTRVVCPPYVIYMLSRLWITFLFFLKILQINRKTPLKLIHAQDTGYAGFAAIMIGKILHIPIIISSHGIRHKTLESTVDGKLKRILLKLEYSLDVFTIKNADSVIAINSSIRDYYEQIVSKKIIVIPIPIELKSFEFSEINRDLVRKELNIENKTKVVGFVGRLSSEKNLLTLMESFVKVLLDNSSIKLVFVGTGPMEFKLREFSKKNSIEENVIFCGLRNDIGRILSSFDIFVLPSYVEGLSTALLEAMASGRAIICSDIPANRMIITHDEDGMLVDPHNPEQIRKYIHLLSRDESLRSKLGNNAKINVNQYDEKIVFPKILEHYSIIIKKKMTK